MDVQQNAVHTSAHGPDAARLLRLAVRCPACGSRPAIRVTAPAVRDAAKHPPEERLATYKCHRQTCGTLYDLQDGAFRDAL